MAVRRLHHEQPEQFAFSPENRAWAETTIANYPEGKQASAVIPLLWRGQEQEGWVTEPMIAAVAGMLGMADIRVLEVATFYTMYHLAPVGRKAHVQVCGTTPCMLRGSEDLKEVCRKRIHPEPHHLSADGDFSWEEAECLGACVNAPMVQISKDTYEDLTPAAFEAVLDAFANGLKPRPGPQIDRHLSAPVGGATTLLGEGVAAGSNTGHSNGERTGRIQAPPGRSVSSVSAMSKAAREAEEVEIEAKLEALAEDASSEERADAVGERPPGLQGPRGGEADDLKRIKGIGRINQDRLNALGLFHFDQIAALRRPEVLWLGIYLAFPGRMDREDWLGQARMLAAGGETEFSKRVDEGEVQSSLDEEDSV